MKNNKEQRVIKYKDELNDEFSSAQIIPRKIDGSFKYNKTAFWEFFSWLFQNILSFPIKFFYLKFKFHHKFIGKEKLKKYKKSGVFIYSNHTQPFSDTFTPSQAIYPTRNFLIVNPENISMKGSGWVVEFLGAIPVPGDSEAAKNFIKRIENRVNKGYSVTIYPEAHIWPYYTKIRPFKSVSFKYPAKFKKPIFAITNTYQKKGKRVNMVSYVDGPFMIDENISVKDNQEKLRNEVYNVMCKRSQNNNVEVIKYIKDE